MEATAQPSVEKEPAKELSADELARKHKRLLTDLSALFHQLDRCVTLLRVYPPGHPLVDNFCEQVASRFESIIGEQEELVIKLRSSELLTEWDEPFFSQETTEREQFLWYTPFSDGIFTLIFKKGVTAEEVQRLMQVVNRVNQGKVSVDDDAVTLLWDQHFSSIDYFAVEGFIDAATAEAFGGLTEPEARDLIAEAAISPMSEENRKTVRSLFQENTINNLDVFTRMQVEAGVVSRMGDFRKSDLAMAFSFDPHLVEKLMEQWRAGNDLEYRYIEALISIIRTQPGTEAAQEAGELIVRIATQMLDEEMYGQAYNVLDLLHERRGLFEQTGIDPLQDILEPLSDPLRIEALFSRLQKLTKERENIINLLGLLDQDVVQRHALLLLADEKKEMPNPSAVVDVLFKVTHSKNSARVTDKDYIEKAIYLHRILHDLPQRDFIDWPATLPLLQAGVRHAKADIRLAALNVEHPCWRTDSFARNYLVPLVQDGAEDVRQRTFELLSEAHPELFREVLSEVLENRKLKGRSAGEMRFLMRTAMQYDHETVGRLRELLKTRGWFGATRRDLARSAATILIGAGDREAIALIRARADSFLTHPSLRKSYQSTLRQLVRPQLESQPATDKES